MFYFPPLRAFSSALTRCHSAWFSARWTYTALHFKPRTVVMFRSLSAAAICRREVAPAALIAAMTGSSSAPRFSASAKAALGEVIYGLSRKTRRVGLPI